MISDNRFSRFILLFTLPAHRYERRSVLLTSNLVFSEWERIFKDPMTTAAAIYKLSAKTGAGPLAEGRYLGWFVGYLETKDNVYFFATNLEGESSAAIRDRRINLTKQILIDMGYLRRQ